MAIPNEVLDRIEKSCGRMGLLADGQITIRVRDLITEARENGRLRDDANALRTVARRAEVLVKRIFARVNFEAATTDVCEALRAAGIEV